MDGRGEAPARRRSAGTSARAHEQGRPQVASTIAETPARGRVGRPIAPKAMRIGYLIPEFPGQTHIFFWREMRELAGLGVHADLVSTRRPHPSIVCHQWSREAMAHTAYLFPPGPLELAGALAVMVAAGPRAWAR